jgi:hypothetical protein
MDFVFDRIASGRSVKCLVVVDDGTQSPLRLIPNTRLAAIT